MESDVEEQGTTPDEGSAEDSDTAVVVVQPPAEPVAPQPVVVTREDRLWAENVNLKLMNAVAHQTLVQQQLTDATRRVTQRQKDLEEVKVRLAQKYSVNFDTHEIRESDGMVVPRGVNQQALVGALSQLRGRLEQ